MRVANSTRIFIAAAFGLNACVTPISAPPQVDKNARSAETLEQRKRVLQVDMEKRRRVNDISFNLSRANVALCPRVRTMFGFGFHSAGQYSKKFTDAATALYQIGDTPKVLYVIADSPAAKTGLASGDEFLTLDGEVIKPGKKSSARFFKMLEARNGKTTLFSVRRDGEILDKTIIPVEVCDIPVGIARRSAINAQAYGRSVTINDGMLRFTQNDEELALVMAHEFAHNTMGHIRAQKTNIGFGFAAGLALDMTLIAFGIFAPAVFSQGAAGVVWLAYSADFEREADYVGSYYYVRAGYDMSIAENFWRRMGEQNPDSIELRTTHPPTADRFLALQKTFEEITRKQAEGLPLVPEVKPGRKAIRERIIRKPDPDQAQ